MTKNPYKHHCDETKKFAVHNGSGRVSQHFFRSTTPIPASGAPKFTMLNVMQRKPRGSRIEFSYICTRKSIVVIKLKTRVTWSRMKA